MALDNARLYEERDQIAQNLQRGLRPPEPPYVPGLDIAVVFDTFGEGMEIGGDLYDILPTEDGCWIMIGDVTGKGSVAAGVSVALRHSMRGLARQIDEPSELLAQLNEMLLEGRSLNDFATALLLRLRRDGERWQAHPGGGRTPAGDPRHQRGAGAARRRLCPRRLGRRPDAQPRSRAARRRDPGPRHRRLVRGGPAGDAPGRRRRSASWPARSPTSSWAR